MNILVTGGAGFIGSHLVDSLLSDGHNVVCLDDLSLGCKENIQHNFENSNFKFVELDILDVDGLKKVFAEGDFDCVFHLAAIARPMAIAKELYFAINEGGTRNLLEACKGKNLKKIIIMSSISAVGPTRDGKPVDERTPCKPSDTYGLSKLAQEKVAIDYLRKYGLPIVMLRPPMVFGPRDDELLKLFRGINTRFFPVRGTRKVTEFLYVGNLIEACLLAMEKGAMGEVYHVSNGESYSINEIIYAIAEAQGKKLLPVSFPGFVWMVAGGIVEIFAKTLRFHPPLLPLPWH